MLGPMSNSLLTRLLFAMANFASRELLGRSYASPNQWHVFWFTVAFIFGRSTYTKMIGEWIPKTDYEAVSKDIVATFLDSNWTVAMFIVVQWGIDLFEEWWMKSCSVVEAIAVTEVPILLMQTVVVAVAITNFGSLKSNKATVDASKDILSQLNFSIGFFIAERVQSHIDMMPEVWDFLWILIGFTCWYNAVNSLFALWVVPKDDPHVESLKFIFTQNVSTMNTAAILIVTAMFVNIFSTWWGEGENFIVAGSLFNLMLFGVIFLVTWESNRNRDPNSGEIPDYMINRGLFAMAMFMAERGAKLVEVHKTLFQMWWLMMIFLVFNSNANRLMDMWSDAIERRMANALTGGEGFEREIQRLKGQRIIFKTTRKTVETWFTITVLFIVQWLVLIFAYWWESQGDWITSVCLIQVTLLLLITLVKVAQWWEGVYDRMLKEAGAVEHVNNFGLH